MEPENQASLMGRNSMLARGTECSSTGRYGTRLEAVIWSNQAMTAAPITRMEAKGTRWALRQASTAASSPARSFER